MQKCYRLVQDSGERINVDVYPPQLLSAGGSAQSSRPVILVVCGGGGKDARSGAPLIGKHAAGYHDLGQYLSLAGFWAVIPSRRGDPQRTPDLRPNLAAKFHGRLPLELFQDEGPNEGMHTHRRHVAELAWLARNLSSVLGLQADARRIGILGKSAGGGVALALAAELKEQVASVALWATALRTSQWFAGPKADSFFRDVLDQRNVRYERETFLREMCDAIDFVGSVKAPILFACGTTDPYAPEPPESDKWSSVSEQIELMRYAIKCRRAKVVAVKGAEHTMYAEQPGWRAYASTITGWFSETMLEG